MFSTVNTVAMWDWCTVCRPKDGLARSRLDVAASWGTCEGPLRSAAVFSGCDACRLEFWQPPSLNKELNEALCFLMSCHLEYDIRPCLFLQGHAAARHAASGKPVAAAFAAGMFASRWQKALKSSSVQLVESCALGARRAGASFGVEARIDGRPGRHDWRGRSPEGEGPNCA